MAKITIVSTANSVQVDFGDYSASLEREKGCWRLNDLHFSKGDNFIEAIVWGEKAWCLSHDGNNTTFPTFQVDSVNTVAPTSLADLYTKLETLIA